MAIVDQLREFLLSTKVDEAVGSDLRKAISVDTGLQKALHEALMNGQDVVVAGSAGSGKTHLLKSVARPEMGLPPFVEWPKNKEPVDEPFIRLVSDFTPLTDEDRSRVFEDCPSHCRSVAIAVNEGPLLGVSRSNPSSVFRRVVEMLHAAQNGIVPTHDMGLPTVFDAAGYDPIADDAIADMLGRPILTELVNSLECGCEDESICPRRIAWAQLASPEVRKRLNRLLGVTNVYGQPVLFRELWDFIADLALGGSCQDEPSTSPWFWRVFFGTSSLSSRLREVADPSLTVFPRAEAHAWYGDWHSSEIEILEGIDLVFPTSASPFDSTTYRWIKTQLFFVMSFDTLMDVIRDQIDLQLAEAIDKGRADAIIAAINAYMTYGVVALHSADLSLWTDLRVERAHGQVSLGEVPARDFRVRRSLAVGNHPDPETRVSGSRGFLVHEAGSSASLSLAPESLRLIREGRSHRTVDRSHTDMEWHLSRFFSQIASVTARPDHLSVLELDFASMQGQIRSYRLDLDLSKAEPVGGW